MTASRRQHDELCTLLGQMKEGITAPRDVDRVDELVRNDPDMLHLYVEYTRLLSDLRFGLTDDRITATLTHLFQTDPSETAGKDRQWPERVGPVVVDDLSSAFGGQPAPRLDAPPATGIAFSFGNVLSGWPVAYLIATVVCGVGAVIGAITHVSQPSKTVPGVSAVAENRVPETSKQEYVAQITGMVGCRWSGGMSPLVAKGRIELGRRFALRAGLIEITYDSGAKTVLQGPVTYEVDSKNGGFLAVGKMTGKVVGKNGERFAVRTPTAIVTDLGTEFGIDVDANGTTTSHVFQGLVEVQVAGLNHRGETRHLHQDETIVVEKKSGTQDPVFVDQKIDPNIFVRVDQPPPSNRATILPIRQRWLSHTERLKQDPALVAYYTFESVRKDNPSVLPNLSAAGRALDAQIHGAEWVLGRLPGKYALLFHGPGSGDKVVLPEPDRFNFKGPFSLAVWFRVVDFGGAHEGLITKGDHAWRFQQESEHNELTFGSNYGETLENGTPGKTAVNDRQWHLGVIVYEPVGNTAQKRLYVDGQLDASSETPAPLNPTDAPVWIGSNSEREDRELQGWIDEVAIFSRALSAGDVQAMYEAGCPANEQKRKSE